MLSVPCGHVHLLCSVGCMVTAAKAYGVGCVGVPGGRRPVHVTVLFMTLSVSCLQTWLFTAWPFPKCCASQSLLARRTCHVLTGTLTLLLEEPPETDCRDAVARFLRCGQPAAVCSHHVYSVVGESMSLPGWVYPGGVHLYPAEVCAKCNLGMCGSFHWVAAPLLHSQAFEVNCLCVHCMVLSV